MPCVLVSFHCLYSAFVTCCSPLLAVTNIFSVCDDTYVLQNCLSSLSLMSHRAVMETQMGCLTASPTPTPQQKKIFFAYKVIILS